MGRQPLPTDTILGNGSDQYRIDTVLGPGGFGVTYLARDLRFDRDVAIKEYFPAEFAYREGTTTIRSSTRGSNQDYFEQGKRHFLDEARTLAKFRHEHIVRVLNLFEQFNTAYMVLEFEEGQSLKGWLRSLDRPATQAELDNLFEPLLAALEVVHAKGMFHRDIAPDNVIIRPNGKPVLIDFGAARHFVREHSHTIGAIVKHGFSPPEQYTLDTKLQGAWSDIYALSATIYAAMMGAPPDEASRRQLNDTVLPVEHRLEPHQRERYRSSLYAALNAGLQLKPKDRPQTISAFRSILHGEVGAGGAAVPELAGVGAAVPEAGRLDERRSLATATRRGAGTGVAPAPAEAGADPGSVSGPGLDIAAGRKVGDAPAATSGTYPERPGMVAAVTALAVAAVSAAAFLWIGGISHPGGLAAAMLVCAGIITMGLERMLAIARVGRMDVARVAVGLAVMSTLAMAIYWLPFFFWQFSLLLAAIAALFAVLRFGTWVPITLLGLAVLHLAAAALLIVLSTRSVQKDPLFLPLMGISLAILAGLVTVSAIHIRRRWEAA
ncbi:MAG: serine/threonine-protein kinase [Hyphomicrobiaceae bacterium]